MKKVLFFIIAMVCVALNVQASISVWPTKTNGVDGYGIYNWDNPGDVAAFLDGSYQGTVYNGNDPDDNWVTTLLPLVKAAETVKFGGSADSPKEPIGTTDLQALELLTGVKYLRLDNCFPAEGTDFSKIKIGSSALLDATMPVGLTKDQIEQANNALKATATGLKTTSGITGTVTTTSTNHYWYTIDGTEYEYTGDDAASLTEITVTDMPVMADLKPADGNPKYKFTNKFNDNKETVVSGDIVNEWGEKILVPNPLEVKLTERNGKYYYTRPNWQDTEEVEYTGERFVDPDNGNTIGKVSNSWAGGQYGEMVRQGNYSLAYTYTYNTLEGGVETVTYDSPQDGGKIQVGTVSGTYPLTMTTEVTKELTVDGSTVYVNEAGTLSDADYMFTNAQNTNFKSSKNITVMGSVNDTDLGYLGATNFASAKLIDVSETTKASGATYGTLTSAATDAALFLPKAVTKAELIVLEEPNFGSRTCAYVEKEDENGNRVMHVYACQGSVANLAPVVDNKTALYFLKRYTSTGDTWAGANYPSGNENFRLGLGALHAISMDFTNYQAYLMPDFRHLTSDTHFLTVAQNDAKGTDDVNFTLDTDASNYKYTDDVWVVSTYKANDNVGKTYGNSQTLTTIGETALITYIREAGKMEQAAPFLSQEQQNASRVIFVTKDGVSMTESDIECISYMNCNKLDFLDATVSDANLLALDNDNVKYIALPDNSAAITATSPDEFSFSKCASLLSVASYNTTTNTYRVHSTKNLDENGDQIESVYVVTSLIRPKPENRSTGNMANGLDKVEFSGYFNNLDIATPVNTTNCGLHDAGSITVADFTNAVFPDNHDMNFNAAGWENLTSINLPTSNQMTIIPANCLNNNSDLTYLCIPYNYQVIEDGALWLTGVDHLTTTDANGALVDNGDKTWTLSANIKQLGLPSENGHVSVTVFPQNLGVEEIYSLAVTTPLCYADVFPANSAYGWGGDDSSKPYCRDRYYNGGNKMQAWAVLHYPSQESYDKAAGAKQTSYDLMQKLYTDVNKEFTKKEQTGAVDANGKPIAWPTHYEGYRAYNQATAGLTWNDWTVNRESTTEGWINGGNGIPDNDQPTGTLKNDYDFTGYEGWHQIVLSMATYVEPAEKKEGDKIIREYEEAGYYTFCIPFNMTNEQVVKMLGVPAGDGENVICKVYDSKGALINGDVRSDMMPEIRQLSSVTRKKGENGNSNVVTLRMTPDLANAGTSNCAAYLDIQYFEGKEKHVITDVEEYNSTKPINNMLCLIGGRPYIIKAYKRRQIENGVDLFKIKKQNLGQYVLEHYADDFGVESSIVDNAKYPEYLQFEQLGPTTGENANLKTLRFAKPFEEHRVQAVRADENTAYLTYETDENGITVTKKYYYTMVGQFWQQPLPMYCLYMSRGNWYRYTGAKDADGNRYTWDPYKCIIMATEEVTGTKGAGYRNESTSVYPEVEANTKDKLNETFKLQFLDGRNDDDFDKNGTYSRYIFSFDDDIVELDEEGNEVTAIQRLDGEDIAPANVKVYNVAGQYVGESLDGLTKGLYIVNGKKIVIK